MGFVDVVLHLLELLHTPLSNVDQSLDLLSGLGIETLDSLLELRFELSVVINCEVDDPHYLHKAN